MYKLYDEVRARIMLEIMKIANIETTLGDMEQTLSNIERILIDEKILKVKK